MQSETEHLHDIQYEVDKVRLWIAGVHTQPLAK